MRLEGILVLEFTMLHFRTSTQIPFIYIQEYQMKGLVRCASFFTLVGMLVVSNVSGSNAQDKKITKKDLPSAVLRSFEAAYPKAKVNNYAKEVEKGVTYYELETMEGKIKRDLLYNADGTLEEAEEILTPGTVPEILVKSIEEEYPRATILSGEKTSRGSEISFDVVIAAGKDRVNVTLSGDGKIQKRTVMKPKR